MKHASLSCVPSNSTLLGAMYNAWLVLAVCEKMLMAQNNGGGLGHAQLVYKFIVATRNFHFLLLN